MGRLRQIIYAPVLAVQAVGVIRRTPRLPEAAGPRADECGQGPALRLLILGDSSAAGVGVDNQHQALSGHLARGLSAERRVVWQLVARTGMATAKLPAFLDATCTDRFDIAVTALGVNDATRLVSPARWVTQTRRLHQTLRAKHAVRRIYATTMPPLGQFAALPVPLSTVLGAHATVMQAALDKGLAADRDVRSIDPDWGLDPTLMARDGFHPGPQIYRRWGEFAGRMILGDLRANPL